MENPLSEAHRNPRATADGLFRLLVIENNATEQEFKELIGMLTALHVCHFGKNSEDGVLRELNALTDEISVILGVMLSGSGTVQ
jgi:hypothetical protein